MRPVTFLLAALFVVLPLASAGGGATDAAGDERFSPVDIPCEAPQIDLLSTEHGTDSEEFWFRMTFASSTPRVVCAGQEVSRDQGRGTFVHFSTRCFPGDFGFSVSSYINDPSYGTAGTHLCFPNRGRAFNVGEMRYDGGVLEWRLPVAHVVGGNTYDMRDMRGVWEVKAVDPEFGSGFIDEGIGGTLR